MHHICIICYIVSRLREVIYVHNTMGPILINTLPNEGITCLRFKWHRATPNRVPHHHAFIFWYSTEFSGLWAYKFLHKIFARKMNQQSYQQTYQPINQSINHPNLRSNLLPAIDSKKCQSAASQRFPPFFPLFSPPFLSQSASVG